MKHLNVDQRKARIIARGEGSNHSHVVVGDAEVVKNNKGEIMITVGSEGAVLRHLLESDFVNTGNQSWTNEHADIDLTELPNQVRHGDVMLEKVSGNTYKYIPQMEFDPYTATINAVRD